METPDLDWVQLFLGLVGGLALFLLGMDQLTNGLRAMAGRRLKGFLQRTTRTRFSALFSGALVTAATQSSSITTVLLVGFGSIGLVTLNSSVGMILGANVGSTVTAQIIAFNITRWGLLLVAVGFFARLFRRREWVGQAGGVVLGLGLIFFGMDLMSEATRPLRDYPPFVDWMGRMENPALGILCGALFTAVVQSSAATTGLVIVLADEGFLSLEGAIALALGANIGTCVTAMLAAIGRPRAALRIALVHVGFNVGGVLIWLPFLPSLAELSALSADWLAGGSIGRAVANAHTFFNLINAGLFLGFTGTLAALALRLVPEREAPDGGLALNRFIDDYYLTDPESALSQVRAEVEDFLAGVARVHRDLSAAVVRADRRSVAGFSGIDDQIDERQAALLRYLGKLSEQRLTRPQQKDLNTFVGIVNQIENLGDLMDHVFLGLCRDLLEVNADVSEPTAKTLGELADAVQKVFGAAGSALREFSEENAGEVVHLQREVRKMARRGKDDLAGRLGDRDDDRLRLFRIEVDLMECHARSAHLLAEMAREIMR